MASWASRAAFVYISRSLQERIEPKHTGWLSVEDAWNLIDFKLVYKKTPKYFRGDNELSGIHVMDASLKLLEEFGFDEIEERILDNSEYFIRRLKEIG